MSTFLPTYGTTTGPVGVPMSDAQAFALDEVLKGIPAEDRVLRKAALPTALTAIEPGERADISWISTEATDRDREIVLASGLRDTHFQINPLVTLGHNYHLPPVGQSVWRKAADHPAGFKGILAKTHYPARPDNWPGDKSWHPDETLALIQAGLLAGKSIGFLATKRRFVEDSERKSNPALSGVQSIIQEWILLEYAVCPIPVNPLTVTQTVSKSFLSAIGWASTTAGAPQAVPALPDVPFVTEDEVHRAIGRMAEQFDPDAAATDALSRILDRHRGRV